jgi:hypothetical protein
MIGSLKSYAKSKNNPDNPDKYLSAKNKKNFC